MESKRLKFDAEIIDYKSYATKDYLELSMRPISSINPNNNNSWFTEESLKDAVEVGTFKNKPILGYFENDDFVSHNGAWKKDSETGVDYWDTLGAQGERILGVIRSEDPVEVVKEDDGLSWIHLDCVLWVQYCFKQVKRLLKDAVKAKNNGGTTKNVSVEVDILDYETLENGVMKINKFNLVGVTILGTRNGRKVQPGIDNADLSVVDIMGREVYDKQMTGLRLAYEKLDVPEVISKENKKEFGKMENENEQVVVDPQNSDLGVQNEGANPQNFEEDSQGNPNGEQGCNEEIHVEEEHGEDGEGKDGEECPECGKNPCECEACGGEGDGEQPQPQQEEAPAEEEPTEPEEEGHEDESCHENEGCGEEPNPKQEALHCEAVTEAEFAEPAPNPIRDLAWLSDDYAYHIAHVSDVIAYYEGYEGELNNKELIVKVLKRILGAEVGIQGKVAFLIGKLAEDFTEEEEHEYEMYEKYTDVIALAKDFEALTSTNEALSAEASALRERVVSYEHKEFLAKASQLIASAGDITEEQAKEFYASCENKEITNIDDLKAKVALAVFEAVKKPVEENSTTISFEADVTAPKTSIETGKNPKMSRWERMKKNVSKE